MGKMAMGNRAFVILVVLLIITLTPSFGVSVSAELSSQLYVGNLATDQNGCVYLTVLAESGQGVPEVDMPNRYALYHLPENYPRAGAVIVTGIEGDPFPLVSGVPQSYFQTPQCQSPVIYVLDIASNGGLSLTT